MLTLITPEAAKMKAPTDYTVISRSESTYPQNLSTVLGKKAPENIYVLGNLALLRKPGIGFCGSRKASDRGLTVAKECAEQIAVNNINVVSGYASGVDLMTHYASLAAGGTTILVLPEGITHFRIKKALKDVWDWERVLVISQFIPDAVWAGYKAMERNLTIIGLTKAMIVIESGDTGGTFHAGMSTLKYNMPLYVINYENMPELAPGNDKLIKYGAKKVFRSKETGKAKLDDLIRTSFNISNYNHLF